MSNGPQPSAGITLISATEDDIPALVQVHTAAFESDLFSALMLLNRPEGTHQALMQKSLEIWFADDPNTQIIKAVDDADENVVGWACWVLKGAEADKTKASSSGPGLVSSKVEETESADSVTRAEIPAVTASQDLARVLGGRMHADMVRCEQARLKGKTYMVLQALATDPGFQGRGIGSRLVQWGTELADAEGMPCWAHASPAGSGVYARTGFEEVGRSDYDLARWAPGGEKGRQEWGVYTFRYMLRPAREGGGES